MNNVYVIVELHQLSVILVPLKENNMIKCAPLVAPSVLCCLFKKKAPNHQSTFIKRHDIFAKSVQKPEEPNRLIIFFVSQ